MCRPPICTPWTLASTQWRATCAGKRGNRDRREFARTFERTGWDYDRYRPTFPGKAVDLLVPAPVGTIVDLGAGTGKLTGLLIDRADRVIAVDPSEAMLGVLREKLPTVRALQGVAESIPLPDASADTVVVAQAFHWFDRDEACAQIARVLRRGGRLGLIWNRSDPACAWDYACGRIVPHLEQEPTAQPATDELPGFILVESAQLHWMENIAREDYLRRWHTVSSFLAADARRHAKMTADIESVLDRDPDTQGRDILSLSVLSDVFVYRRAVR